MTKPPDQHATTADIQAILKARRDAVTPQSIPATPLSKPAPSIPPMKAQSIQAPPPTPAPAPTTPPVSDTDLTTFLGAHLPALKDAAVALGKPPFHFDEVLVLAKAVSGAVSEGMPLVKGTQAGQLVNLITAYLFDTYAAPNLPATVKPFSGVIRSFLLASIEPVYRFIIKKVGQK